MFPTHVDSFPIKVNDKYFEEYYDLVEVRPVAMAMHKHTCCMAVRPGYILYQCFPHPMLPLTVTCNFLRTVWLSVTSTSTGVSCIPIPNVPT